MSNNTKSGYTKTGKKVKTIDSDLIDLTYNDVYEVFIDNDGDEFIIDDVGDKSYGNIDDNRYYELVDDVANIENKTTKSESVVVRKFKVGDTVRVTSIDNIHEHTETFKVGDIEVIIDVDDDDYDEVPYKIRDWWFSESELELVTNDINDNTKTKPKFKVGDKVKVVDIGHISQATSDVKVGDVGVITYVDSDYVISPYRVEFDDDYWWFTDKCIELVYDDAVVEYNPTEKTPIVSDGGSSSYYAQQIPKGMLERFNATGTIEAKDVIRLFLGNDFNMGNIFKAYCRVISLRNGKGKAGIDEQYDLTKAKFFTEDELNYYLENKDV